MKQNPFIMLIFLCLFLFACVFIGNAQPPEQHVILVIIDGARYSETLGDPTDTYTPRIRMLATQGSFVQTFLNDSLTYTARAIPAIWCGSWSPPHDTSIGGYPNQYATVPTVWEYFRKDRNLGSEDAMYIVKNMSRPWQQSYHAQYGPPYWPWYIIQGITDLDVWQNAKTMLETYHPKFAVLYFADVDYEGHYGNWSQYTRAIVIADSIVGLLSDFLREDSIFKNTTTVLVTNDHGRHTTDYSGHGDGCLGCRQIILAAAGPAVKQHFESTTNRSIPDITPTIGSILNFTSPYSSGHSMTELFVPIYYREHDSINFGDVLAGAPRIDSFKLYNSGAVPLTISSIVSSDMQVTVDRGNAVISPHSTKTFIVTCSPTGLNTAINASIVIRHNASSVSDTVQVSSSVATSCVVAYNSRWNIVSVPVLVSDWEKDSTFSLSVSPAYAYEGHYQIHDLLKHGAGYWIKFSGVHTDTLLGHPMMIDTVTVSNGWNLIGSISKFVATTSIASDPPGIITGNFFGYKSGYIKIDTIFPGKGYWVKVRQAGKLILSASGMSTSSSRIKIISTSELPPSPPDEAISGKHEVPTEYALEQSYPNPFNPSTIIRYDLPIDAKITLKMYNVLGQEVRTVVDEIQDAGFKTVNFNASDMASGVYFYRIDAVGKNDAGKTFTQVKKMLLLK